MDNAKETVVVKCGACGHQEQRLASDISGCRKCSVKGNFTYPEEKKPEQKSESEYIEIPNWADFRKNPSKYMTNVNREYRPKFGFKRGGGYYVFTMMLYAAKPQITELGVLTLRH